MSRYLLVVLAACGSAGSGAGGQPPVVEQPPVLAPSADADRDMQCRRLFDLFEHQLSPGATGPQAAAVLGGSMSLINIDQPITQIGGELPIEIDDADSLVVVHCLATPHPPDNAMWSPWAIYLRISGHSAPTLHAFLAAGPDVVLREYALVSGNGPISRHR